MISIGGWNKIEFLNFKFSMHMGVPWVYRNTFYFIGTPLFFKFCPYLGQKTSLQTVQKPKGGPLDEKIFFFQKLSPIFLKHVPNDCICRPDSKNMYNMGSKHPIRPVHALCTLCTACIERAQALRALSYNNMYVFGISTTNAVNWNMF